MASKDQWRVAVGSNQSGPFTFEQLAQLIRNRQIPANAMVWKEGMAEWKQWIRLPEFTELVPLARTTWSFHFSNLKSVSTSLITTANQTIRGNPKLVAFVLCTGTIAIGFVLYLAFSGPPNEYLMEMIIANVIYGEGVSVDGRMSTLKNPTIVEMKIVNIGSKQRSGEISYWPVQVTYRGTGDQLPMFYFEPNPKTQVVRFRGSGKFAIYKDEFGEWGAQRLGDLRIHQ